MAPRSYRSRTAKLTPAALIPVIAGQERPKEAVPRLQVRLPKGVKIELEWRPRRSDAVNARSAEYIATFGFDQGLKGLLHRDSVDTRKGINGLVALVEQTLGLDPFAPTVYAFTNERRDRVRLLLWDGLGFWLMMKRLEADRFVWPREARTLEWTVEQLHWLLDGIDLAAVRKHSVRHYKRDLVSACVCGESVSDCLSHSRNAD